MEHKGFTLIELMIGIMIIGILSLALGNSLQGTMATNRVEGQTKQLYSDMVQARSLARQRNRIHFVVLGAESYQITEDTNQSGGVAPDAGDTPMFATPKLFSDPVVWPAIWPGGTIVMNTGGVVEQTGAIWIKMDIAIPGTPDYDCIQLSTTRIKMGRWDNGNAECDVK